jgi:predicted metal-dependent HD superfamily phosphohydrolase
MMEAAFADAWRELTGRPPSPEHFPGLLASYREPHRAYHNLRHIEDCLGQFEAVRSEADRPAEIVIALWYHDVVYDPRATDNEERSADRAAEALTQGGAPSGVIDRVRSLILATKHTAVPTEPDAQLLVDIDLSILGREPDVFEQYDGQIRREYAWVEEPTYRAARARVLGQFLVRPRIYQTESFHTRFEARARRNLARKVEELSGG